MTESTENPGTQVQIGDHATIQGSVDLSTTSVQVGDISEVTGTLNIAAGNIVQHINAIYERALSAAEDAQQSRKIELQALAQGVSQLAQRLQQLAADSEDALERGPYRGLLEYRLGDAELFVGRSQAIQDMMSRLSRGRLTILHSESGAGKTSLLQAGIAPRLIASGHLALYVRPYDANPVDAIKKAFLPDLTQSPGLHSASLREFLIQVTDVVGDQNMLYIFLDQFEEVFTRLEDEPRTDFVRQLAECLDDELLRVRWVFALRTEYFGNLANFRPRIRNPFENDYRLNRMTRLEATEVITEPVKLMNVRYEPELVEAILDDLGGQEIAPPQIQLVCSNLFSRLKAGERVISLATYDAEGRAAGILSSHLQNVLSRQLSEDHRKAARRLLESLITSEQQRLVRSQKELTAELEVQGITPQTLDTILSQLTESRLLRINESEAGVTYELAHDYLLKEVRLDPEVQARKAAQELLEQELRASRTHQTFLSVDRLRVIEQYKGEMNLTPEAHQLLNASRKKVNRQTLMTMMFISGGLFTVFAIVFVVTLNLVNQIMFNRIQQNVVQALQGSVKVIDTNNFTSLITDFEADPDNMIDDERYWSHQDEILIIQELFPEVETVYTYIPGSEDGEILFVGDSWRENEFRRADSSYFKEGYIFPEGVGFLEGFSGTVPPDSTYEDAWGTWVSGFTPIKNDFGDVIGALGIDISVEYLNQIQEQVLISLLPPFAIIAILFLAMTWFSAWITRRGGVRWPKYKLQIQKVE
jgi:hypothetical protein